MNRRTFLGAMGAACVAGVRMSADSVDRIGMQLYTVRTELEKDFEGTIARVAGIGFKEVEFAGYYKRSPKEIRDVLSRNGLTAPAAHIDYTTLTTRLAAAIDDAGTIGHAFLVNPWIDESLRKQPDSWKRFAESFNRAGEQCRKAGIQFAYHNHHFEFAEVDGRLPFDLLLEQCDPELVKIELDLFWITAAGRDPLNYFTRHPGRFPLVHVKGLAKKGGTTGQTPIDQILPSITDVGSGDVIDWKRIFARSREAGIRHYFVEHDVPKAPLASLKASYDYLRGLQF